MVRTRIILIWFVLVIVGIFSLSACYEEILPTQHLSTVTKAVSSTATSTLQPKPTSSPTPIPTSSLGVDAEALNGQVVRFWHPWSGESEKVLNELIDQFNAENEWDIQVEPIVFTDIDQLWEQVKTARQAGQAPELIVGNLHQILASDHQEAVVDLAPYIADPIWGLTPDQQADYYPVFLDADLIGGRRVGFPALRSGQVLYYNQTRAQELGFSAPPLTPVELKEQACAAAEANLTDDNLENDGMGGWIISTQYATSLGWLESFGVPVVDEAGTGYQFAGPQTEAAFGFLRELYDQGCSWLPESDFVETEFAAGDGLYATGSVTGIPYQAQAFTDQSRQTEWTVLPFPSPQGKSAFPVFGPSFASLPSSPEAQLASWLFMSWLSKPENQARWVEANGSLPLQKETVKLMLDYKRSYPQWSTAVDFLEKGVFEPPFSSWGQVRWALYDATTQLYRPYFSAEGIPETVKFLQKTAADLHKMAEE